MHFWILDIVIQQIVTMPTSGKEMHLHLSSIHNRYPSIYLGCHNWKCVQKDSPHSEAFQRDSQPESSSWKNMRFIHNLLTIIKTNYLASPCENS